MCLSFFLAFVKIIKILKNPREKAATATYKLRFTEGWFLKWAGTKTIMKVPNFPQVFRKTLAHIKFWNRPHVSNSLDAVKKPLSLWDKKIRNGHVKRMADNELQGLVLEVFGNKIHSTYITCPGDLKKTLGVKFQILVITVKNMNRFFAFDVQILDDNHVRRRFRVSTLTGSPDVKPFTCKLPLILEEGWNQIVFPLQEFTKKIYSTNYKETLRIQIYPNCRIRRVYFTNKLNHEDVLTEYSLLQQEEGSRNKKTLLTA